MTRQEFVTQYAKRSNLPDTWAGVGLIDVGGKTLTALPCACGDDECKGWSMVTADSVDNHLFFYAPEPLRQAYRDAVAALEAEAC